MSFKPVETEETEKVQTVGGGFNVETQNVEVQSETNDPEPEDQQPKSDAELQVAGMMVETGFKSLGKLMTALTQVDEMEFDEDELEQLKTLWTPLMPSMSPVMAALLGTMIIVGGKVAIYANARKKRKDGKAGSTTQKSGSDIPQQAVSGTSTKLQ